MSSTLNFILFLLCVSGFGFVSLSQTIKISSLILLIPLSVVFGLATYVFSCHVFSLIFGPQLSSILTLFFLFFISLLIFILKKKNLVKIKKEINNYELTIQLLSAFIISLLTYLAVSKYGTFDRESHMPISMTIFHNNIYFPRDCFRPDYVLLYHFGGDLLAGAVQFITKFDISKSFELISCVLSGTTFLSFIALAWLLTKNFKLSFISGFCTYLGGGLLWLDAIVRYLTKNFLSEAKDWSFCQTFLSLGIHGGINNAPSVLSFISTFNLGNPLLVLALILLWKMSEEDDLRLLPIYIIFINIALFTLSLTADWLYASFWAATLPFLFLLWIRKKKRIVFVVLLILAISILLNKSIGNALFLQDPFQNLGRTNIFDIGIKENLFTVVGWGRLANYVMNYQTISCFSWDFICELGLTIFLFPIAVIYAIKTKNSLAYLLFFLALMTMPIPTIIDFKLNPVELVRLFAFGNVMLILLITCGISYLYKPFLQKKILVLLYVVVVSLSPALQLIAGAIFSPNVFNNKFLVERLCNNLKEIKSVHDFIFYYKSFNEAIINSKNRLFSTYKSEIDFFKTNSKPKDVALSTIYEIPSYAGVYSLIPPKRLVYWDQLYSSFNSLYETSFLTFDPYLLQELNIKWILITNDIKERLPREALNNLNNNQLFNLAYTNKINDSNQLLEIYKVNDLKDLLSNYKRKCAWILINKNGNLLTLPTSTEQRLDLFSTQKEALLNLKSFQDNKPEFTKQSITAEPIVISNIESKILENKLMIKLEQHNF